MQPATPQQRYKSFCIFFADFPYRRSSNPDELLGYILQNSFNFRNSTARCRYDCFQSRHCCRSPAFLPCCIQERGLQQFCFTYFPCRACRHVRRHTGRRQSDYRHWFFFRRYIDNISCFAVSLSCDISGPLYFDDNICRTGIMIPLGLSALLPMNMADLQLFASYPPVIFSLLMLAAGFFTIFSAWSHRLMLLKGF